MSSVTLAAHVETASSRQIFFTSPAEQIWVVLSPGREEALWVPSQYSVDACDSKAVVSQGWNCMEMIQMGFVWV